MSENFMDKIISENYDVYLEDNSVEFVIEISRSEIGIEDLEFLDEDDAVFLYTKKEDPKDVGFKIKYRSVDDPQNDLEHSVSAKLVTGNKRGDEIPILIPSNDGETADFPKKLKGVSQRKIDAIKRKYGNAPFEVITLAAKELKQAGYIRSQTIQHTKEQFQKAMYKISRKTPEEYNVQIVKSRPDMIRSEFHPETRGNIKDHDENLKRMNKNGIKYNSQN